MTLLNTRRLLACSAAALLAVQSPLAYADEAKTATPIKHLVVIFQENVSFDHYFGTYPKAANRLGSRPSRLMQKRRPTSTRWPMPAFSTTIRTRPIRQRR